MFRYFVQLQQYSAETYILQLVDSSIYMFVVASMVCLNKDFFFLVAVKQESTCGLCTIYSAGLHTEVLIPALWNEVLPEIRMAYSFAIV